MEALATPTPQTTEAQVILLHAHPLCVPQVRTLQLDME